MDLELENGIILPLMEEFYSIQGEGYYTGNSAYFLRIGGCDVGCAGRDAVCVGRVFGILLLLLLSCVLPIIPDDGCRPETKICGVSFFFF